MAEMNMNMNLRNQLTERLLQLCDETVAANINYNPTDFRQMVANDGGYETATKLIGSNPNTTHYGFSVLWEKQRLDLSMEAEILKRPWCELFTQEQLNIAKKRLQLHGYETTCECD